MGDENVLERFHRSHNTPDWVRFLERDDKDEAFVGWMHRNVLKGESIVVHTSAYALSHNLSFDPFGDHIPRADGAEKEPMGPMEESMKDVPLHALSVEEFHKFHRTNDYMLYLEEGSTLPFEAWYSTKVGGVVASTIQIAETNGWVFNPVQYQDGHDGDFSPEDLKLVLRAILTVSGPWDNSPENRPAMTTDEIMSEMGKAPPEVLLKLIRDLTLP